MEGAVVRWGRVGGGITVWEFGAGWGPAGCCEWEGRRLGDRRLRSIRL